jgi:hypothetical protein
MKQKTNHRLIVSVLFSLLVLFSCKKTGQKGNDLSPTDQDNQTNFAKVMAKAVEDKSVRDFLKTEALQKFGGDYDVFLPMVKDKLLSNGVSFKDFLDETAKRQNINTSVEKIIAVLPLVTIMIPETEKFSAEKWNTDNTVPIVGIRNVADIKSKKKMIAYNSNGAITELDYSADPDQPVLVIKDNEALQVVEASTSRTARAGSYQFTKPRPAVFVNNGLAYFYADESLYDPAPAEPEIIKNAGNVSSASTNRIEGGACSRVYNWWYFDPRVQEAFEKNVYQPTCPENTATVRDYVYYGMDPTTGVNRGPLNYGYREYITSIKCDALANRGRFDDFSEGSILDFDIIIYTADSDPIFPLKKRLSVQKDQFFTTDADNPSPLAYEFGGYPRPAIELAVWNFKRQGDIWKFGVFEFDPGTTVSSTKSTSSTLGTNFSIGDEKEGGKFGLTATVTATSSTTITFTDGSDDLGEAVLYWCDPVIKEKIFETTGTERVCGLPHLRRPPRQTNIYARSSDITTGIISLTVEPRFKP